MLSFLKNIGPVEIIVIVVILLLLFGRKLFVALGKTSGETLKEMRNVKKSIKNKEPSEKEVSE